ncbi:DEAD/DEAH box helicase [Neolewinella lacunae]|uniref:DEAD/DEAH box helicase n=1 Tax=Neolewinella lacunae TaxID=1517758 RepID=A0A923PKC9_9BACT|nr:DEAD/DEAH box helicase [Neolewinella lacunae]MBC6993301.1 DEAD/DEAH box helicase [Neolewinella lacunae]MDN3636858.1 DEAD/DEAH box helicase [Neolewinella lacunae]
MKFEDYPLAPEIKRSIGKLGWKRPTDIQYRAIRHILEGEDVMGIAQTGTGKTAAFAIPVVQMIHTGRENQRRKDGIKCLVMVPTRELALQLNEVFTALAKGTRVNVFALTGGVEQDPQIQQLQDGVDILIATPGRMFDLLNQKILRLERVNILILDEADLMLDLGFIADIRGVLGHLKMRRQTLFFSATINEQIKKLAYTLVKKPIRIQISPKDPISRNVDHSVIFIEMDDKRFFLERFLKEHPDAKILTFVRTRVRAQRVHDAMLRVGLPSLVLHGELDQDARNAALEAFRNGEQRLMIATDLSARGIDIPDVTHVINYDLPDQADNYVHRVGRTGRGERRGIAYSFCAPQEHDRLRAIEAYTGTEIRVVELDRQEYRETLHFSRTDNMSIDELLKEAEKWEKKKK